MLKDEYKRLLSMLEEGIESDKVSLEDILKEAVIFFETLREEFVKVSKEEREEMVQMMSHLHSKLQEVSQKTAKSVGMSEEDLSAYAEDPSNYTPEEWQMVQETKRKLYDSSRKFTSSLEKQRREGGEVPSEKPAKRPIKGRTRRVSRKGWTKT